MTQPRVVANEPHDGNQGESLAKLLIEEAGHEFHPTGRTEAGIDGFIELRDRPSGVVDAQIIACQVKTGETVIFNESAEELSWRAAPGDLTYWESSNLPVILVIVRLPTREGWWRAVDEAFPDETARASRVVRFDKARDRLDSAAGATFRAVVDRGRDRRRADTQMILTGPYTAIGLASELEIAQQHERANRWHDAADVWQRIAATGAERGLERRLVWPALDSAARALERASARGAAGEIWLELARARIDDDDPSGVMDVARAHWTGAWTGSPAQQLLAARARLPEEGIGAICDLREALERSRAARDRQAAAASLVDALAFFGEYEEAALIAETTLGVRFDTAHKRQLALDRLDCAGLLGEDVAGDWDRLIADWSDRGPVSHGMALQRRAVHEIRRGDVEAAHSFYRRAGQVWAATDGGNEQLAEVAFSSALLDELDGNDPGAPMPPGMRAAAAIARGSIRTPAARSDRLITSGPAYAVDRNLPDALARLTMAAMLDRRAGNLASWRRASYLLARTYQEADEHEEALRFWLLIGATTRATEASKQLEPKAVLSLARLGSGPGWQKSAGFAALEPHGAALRKADVRSLARPLLHEAKPPPTMLAAHPSMQARRLLAKVADRLPSKYAAEAGDVLAEDVRMLGPNAQEASAGLVELQRRELYDGLPTIIGALLSGTELPVTVAGWLRAADPTVVAPLIQAALAGNQVALAELAAADFPADDDRLRQSCNSSTRASIRARRSAPHQGMGGSFVDAAHIARYAYRPTQADWAAMLCDVVEDSAVDEVSKTSALIGLAVAAPGLEPSVARSASERLLPIADGGDVKSAPSTIRDHANPKRARSTLTRAVPPAGVRSAAIQACGRLAQRLESAGIVEAMLLGALESDQPQVVSMALRELRGLPTLGVSVDPRKWIQDPAPSVRQAAKELSTARRLSPNASP